jgi:hypothetical protein
MVSAKREPITGNQGRSSDKEAAKAGNKAAMATPSVTRADSKVNRLAASEDRRAKLAEPATSGIKMSNAEIIFLLYQS